MNEKTDPTAELGKLFAEDWPTANHGSPGDKSYGSKHGKSGKGKGKGGGAGGGEPPDLNKMSKYASDNGITVAIARDFKNPKKDAMVVQSVSIVQTGTGLKMSGRNASPMASAKKLQKIGGGKSKLVQKGADVHIVPVL
tara:strand:- start:7412 stop:7828 length:417 start_codon:yes stop_codon:yes gene_type:complete